MNDDAKADATELRIRRVIRAPRERVFKAWTTASDVEQWWGPGAVTCPEARFDLSVGGRYSIANRNPDGTLTTFRGEFERVEPPHTLVYSWFIDADPDGETGSRVTVEFRDHEDGTEIVIHHERLPAPEVTRMHLEGWLGCLDGLAAYLQG